MNQLYLPIYSFYTYKIMPNDKMNEFLRNRKIKNKQLASFRKQRIVKNYHKLQKSTEAALHEQQAHNDEGTRRKLEFYQQVFSEGKQQKKQQKVKTEVPQPQVNQDEIRMEKLKSKKKKFIKKMQMEKTKKGQPVMRNYVKYALAKLEETLQREKKDKNKKSS